MRLRADFEKILLDAGAFAVRLADCAPTVAGAMEAFTEWLADGNNAGMDYLANYQDIRANIGTLIEGGESVICCAFPFRPEIWRAESLPRIACYAFGDDYHDTLRGILRQCCRRFEEIEKGEWRVCVDTAPVMERYHAVRSGLGFRGCNGTVIVPGAGSMVFLAEIVTTVPTDRLRADTEERGGVSAPEGVAALKEGENPSARISCLRCGKCVEACPGGAIGNDGLIDARRCISYQSIEHHGDWDATGRETMDTPAGRNTLYGCDICLRVCPHNREEEISADCRTLPQFRLREGYESLTREGVEDMSQEEFSNIFRKSAVKRAKLAGLKRNLRVE